MVSEDDISGEIWLGNEGALASAKHGTVLVESSTLTPGWIAQLEAAARKKVLSSSMRL
jgi:3-hydroxyisobutyrate dehydrogenase